ncbi:MAG: hypothetical protein OHK0029_07010 [Armatimonadaceae bacterium]
MSESKTQSNSPPRREFTEEFKREAVRLVYERGNLRTVARNLGVHESVLSRWKRALEAEDAPTAPRTSHESRSLPAFPGKGNARDEGLVKLQREVHRLKEENEILKKAMLPLVSGIASSRVAPRKIPVHSKPSGSVSCCRVVPGPAGESEWFLFVERSPKERTGAGKREAAREDSAVFRGQ